MIPTLTFEHMVLRIFLAVLLGSLIGLEREKGAKNAGLKTHALICLSCALLMMFSIYLFEYYDDAIRIDVTRIASGVVSGLAILGVAAVLRSGNFIVGITTASTLWLAMSIGLVIGGGFYGPAIAVTGIVLFILFTYAWLQDSVLNRIIPGKVEIWLSPEANFQFVINEIKKIISNFQGKFLGYKFIRLRKQRGTSFEIKTKFSFHNGAKTTKQNFLLELYKIEGINDIEWLQ